MGGERGKKLVKICNLVLYLLFCTLYITDIWQILVSRSAIPENPRTKFFLTSKGCAIILFNLQLMSNTV